ncbi:MAG: pyridine nucleotide-disulfide oxidoreductase [Deltaproteobacteria bacterium]|nr:MAG: pyridine nucleotide-disulfide oxidoreductase [Deltaproteobacteria bacterium]
MGKKIVIVGAVAAGPKAACRVRRIMPEAEVTLIDEDSLISYGGCGIPYFVAGDVADEKELRSTSFHMVRDASFFEKAKGVTVLTRTRAVSIDRKNKTVMVEDLATNEKKTLAYDSLMLATGSSPVRLPIPGADAANVFSVNNLHRAIEIKDLIARGKVGKAVVIGGGAIGIEMAEAFADLWGIPTAIVEFQDQLLPGIVDKPIAKIMAKGLRDGGVDVFLGQGAQEIVVENGLAVGVRTAIQTHDADIVIMAVGIQPRSELAVAAGLQVSDRGAITVNERMQTSDPDIYAAGDCVEITHLVSGRKFMAPFGSMANREGRVAADNMCGLPSVFRGGVASFIVKAFDVAVGSVGLSYAAALREGFDAGYSLSTPSDRAHFYPGQTVIALELVFDKKSRRVLGLQGSGPVNDGLSVRLDAAAVAIAAGATIDDVGRIEMAYSPPFSPAIDPINAAAYIADNLCAKIMRQIDIHEFNEYMSAPQRYEDRMVVDVRYAKEAEPFVEKFGADRWLSLPYEQVRSRWSELPQDKELIIFCNAGSRSFEVQTMLDAVGLKNSLVVPGGFNIIRRMGEDWLP